MPPDTNLVTKKTFLQEEIKPNQERHQAFSKFPFFVWLTQNDGDKFQNQLNLMSRKYFNLWSWVMSQKWLPERSLFEVSKHWLHRCRDEWKIWPASRNIYFLQGLKPRLKARTGILSTQGVSGWRFLYPFGRGFVFVSTKRSKMDEVPSFLFPPLDRSNHCD